MSTRKSTLTDTITGLENTCSKWFDIFQAAQNNDLECVKNFIEVQNVNVNSYLLGSRETALHKAAQQGNLEMAKYLVEKGSNVNLKDKWGYNALLWAVETNKESLDLIKFLLDKGTDKSIADTKTAFTPIHWAAYHDRLDILRYLIDKGLNINAKTAKGDTALTLAAEQGHLDIVTFLIDEKHVKYDGNIYEASNSGYLGLVKYFIKRQELTKTTPVQYNYSALFSAAQAGKINVAKYFLEDQSIDVNIKGGYVGDTALLKACAGGHLPMVQYLVDEKGANLYAFNDLRKNCLVISAQYGNLSILKYLIDEKNVDTSYTTKNLLSVLHWAAIGNNIPTLEYLIVEKKLDKAVRDLDKNTLLHTAAYHGSMNATKYLVENKIIGVDVRNAIDNTPLQLAGQCGHIPILDYLLEHGADLNSKDVNGNTVLHGAASNGKVDVLKHLIDKIGVDINTKNRNNDTPLLKACEYGYLNVVKYLVEDIKVDLNATNKNGRNALMLASQIGTFELVRYLVEEKKMNVLAKDNIGLTSFQLAAIKDHTIVCNYLESMAGKRNRRSAEQNKITPIGSHSNTSLESATTSLLHQHDKYLPMYQKQIGSPTGNVVKMSNFTGTVSLIDFGLRYLNGNKFQQPIHKSLLSPTDIIHKKIDQNAIDAIASYNSSLPDYATL